MGKRIIAISGDPKRGKEVIHLLESIGGENSMFLYGTDAQKYYFVADGAICSVSRADVDVSNFEFHTIDTFCHKYGKDGLMNCELNISTFRSKSDIPDLNAPTSIFDSEIVGNFRFDHSSYTSEKVILAALVSNGLLLYSASICRASALVAAYPIVIIS